MISSVVNRGVAESSARKRWCMLLLFVVAMIGGYMALYMLSPLQMALSGTKGWNLEAYSRYCSAEGFLNVWCLLLPVGGLLIDRLGVKRAGMLAGSLMLLGGILNWYALTDMFADSYADRWFAGHLNLPDTWWNISPFCQGMPSSAKLAAIGFMIFGVGMEMSGIAVSRGTVRWFEGHELATAMGLQLAISRLTVAVTMLISPRLADITGETSVSRPMLWCVAALSVGLVCWLIYGTVQDAEGERYVQSNDKHFSWHDVFRNAFRKRALWILCGICVLYYCAVIPFYRYATAIFATGMDIEMVDAASVTALLALTGALVTPLICLIPDFKGGGVWLILVGCGCLAVCYTGLYLLPQGAGNILAASCAAGFLGISSAAVTAGLWPLVPRLVESCYLGSAYAVFYWVQALGLYLTPLAVARVVAQGNISSSLPLFGALATIALVLTAVLALINKKESLRLNAPNKTSLKALE